MFPTHILQLNGHFQIQGHYEILAKFSLPRGGGPLLHFSWAKNPQNGHKWADKGKDVEKVTDNPQEAARA